MSEQAHRAPPRRRGGTQYPLWLGVLALGGFTALWLASPATPAAEGPPDAAPPPDSAPPPPPEQVPRIEWRIGPRGPIDPGVLDACLAAAGYERALVVGAEPMLITWPGKLRPTTITAIDADDQPALALSTPVGADARLAASLHVATTACLYVEGAEVRDPQLGRVATGADWPQLGEGGGLPVHHLIAVEDVPGGLITRGLARLGRPELGLAVDPKLDGAAALRFVRAYAAAAVVAPAGAERLDRGGGHMARVIEPEAARAAGWWTAPASDAPLKVLADPTADPPAPVALPRAAPPRAPPARAPAPRPARPAPTPKPAKPAPAPKPEPAPRPKPAPKPPVPFSPAYR